MSKTTKIIAALGVVAGLGVAALPAFTFAVGPSVSGDVDLYVEVQPAIAMTITGNNDDRSLYGTPTYSEVEVEVGDSVVGYYTRGGTGTEQDPYVYTAATGSAVAGETYYQRVVGSVDVFAPAEAANTEIDGHLTPAEQKIGPSSSYMALLPNQMGTMTSTVTVYTNNTAGYKLTVTDEDTVTDLAKIGGTNADIIPASATTAVGDEGWSIQGGLLVDKTAMVASDAANPLVIKNTNAKTSDGDATTMTYTVATAADQATGVYADTITYTATCN